MQIKINRYCLTLSVVSMAILLILNGLAWGTEKFLISIPPEKIIKTLQQNDRIAKYTIELSSSRVYGVINLHKDWWYKIKYMESPDIEAFAFHGAGYITCEDVKNGAFTEFLIIETEPDWGLIDIKADLTIDIMMDEKPKHILLEKKDMAIIPMKNNERPGSVSD